MVESLIQSYVELSGVMLCWASLLFAVGILLKRNDIADIAWGLGFVLVILFLGWDKDYGQLEVILTTLILLWGLRLSIYLFFRNSKKSEDFRYAKWRKEWGSSFYWRSFLQVYLLQSFVLLIIAFPLVFAFTTKIDNLSTIQFFAIVIWTLGFLWQTIGDYQLAHFKKENPDKLMTKGLWQYSRHPNYFGEIVMWWSIFLMVLPLPYGFITFIGPLTIHLLVAKVSGVPMLEEKRAGNKEFQKYKEKVPAIFPKLF